MKKINAFTTPVVLGLLLLSASAQAAGQQAS